VYMDMKQVHQVQGSMEGKEETRTEDTEVLLDPRSSKGVDHFIELASGISQVRDVPAQPMHEPMLSDPGGRSTQPEDGMALFGRLHGSGVSSRRIAVRVAGSVTRDTKLGTVARNRPSSARPRLGGPSSALSDRFPCLPRTRSIPLCADTPADLLHASALHALAAAEGFHVQMPSMLQGINAKVSRCGKQEIRGALVGGKEMRKGSLVRPVSAQSRPRLDPSQRLPPPILRKGINTRPLA